MSALQQQDDEMAKVATLRDAIASRIKDLSQRWAENTIALGRELKRARDTFPVEGGNHRPGWHEWLAKNTGWQPRHANSFVRITEKFGGRAVGTTGLSWKVLDYLARDDTPEEAIKEITHRAKRGEVIGFDAAKEIARPHLPTRGEAIKEARETGKLVAARDGHIYSGASEDEMAAYSERRAIVYAIRRAVDAIADCQFTPRQWIEATEPHWISEFRLSNVDAALKWLNALKPLLEKKQKVIGNGA